MKKIASISVLVIFISVLFASLFHMSTGMGMEGKMGDCPFMEIGEVICPMDFAGHIEAWKAAFASVVPTIFTLILIAGTAIAFTLPIPFLFKNKRKPIPIRLHTLRTRTYSYTYRPLQELFSNGILHPKVF